MSKSPLRGGSGIASVFIRARGWADDGRADRGQEALFYEFSLKRHVSADHLRRSNNRLVELSASAITCGLSTARQAPSTDLELMIRMLIIGYCMSIRSKPRLCDEVHLNLAYRWVCRLGLEGDVPDHFAFQKPPWPLPRQRPAAPALT